MSDPNPHYFGRGRLHFTAPLASDGSVDVSEDATLGSNWPRLAAQPANGVLAMAPGRFVGNTKTLTLTPQVQELNVPDFTGDGSGDDADLIEGVQGSIVLLAHGARNLGDALRAVVRQSTGNARSDTAYVGGASLAAGSMLWTSEVIDTEQEARVRPSWTTWTEGVDWQREAMGIRLLSGFAGPANGVVHIDYVTEGEAYWLDAFEKPRVNLGLVFAGTNLFTQRPCRLDCYRALLRPLEDFSVISEQTGEVRISFRLRPIRPVGSARPRWFRVMNGRAASNV